MTNITLITRALTNSRTALTMALALFLAMSSFAYADNDDDAFKSKAEDKIELVNQQVTDLTELIAIAKIEEVPDYITDDVEFELEDGEELLEKAKAEFTKTDYEDAYDEAVEAYEFFDALFETLYDELDNEAEEAIKEAGDMIEIGKDIMNDVDSDHKNFDEAEELLKSAEKLLDEAEVLLKDKKYDEAIVKADEVTEEAEKIFDELDIDIEDYLNDEKMNDALEEIEHIVAEPYKQIAKKWKVEIVYDDKKNGVFYLYNIDDKDELVVAIANKISKDLNINVLWSDIEDLLSYDEDEVDHDKGHGNDDDDCDEDNPGKSKKCDDDAMDDDDKKTIASLQKQLVELLQKLIAILLKASN